MPIIFDEVTVDVANEDRRAPALEGDGEANKPEPQIEEQMRRFLKKLGERCARLFAD